MSFCTINGCWLVCNLLLLLWLFFLIYKPSKSLTTVLGTIILTRGTKSILQCTRSWSWCPPVSKHFTCSVTWPHVDMLWMKSLRVTINRFAVGFKGIGFLSPISSIKTNDLFCPCSKKQINTSRGHDWEGRGDVFPLLPSVSPSLSTVGRSCREDAGVMTLCEGDHWRWGLLLLNCFLITMFYTVRVRTVAVAQGIWAKALNFLRSRQAEELSLSKYI